MSSAKTTREPYPASEVLTPSADGAQRSFLTRKGLEITPHELSVQLVNRLSQSDPIASRLVCTCLTVIARTSSPNRLPPQPQHLRAATYSPPPQPVTFLFMTTRRPDALRNTSAGNLFQSGSPSRSYSLWIHPPRSTRPSLPRTSSAQVRTRRMRASQPS